MKKKLVLAYCIVCAAVVCLYVFFSFFTPLVSFEVEYMGSEYSEALSETVIAVRDRHPDEADANYVYNSYIGKILNPGKQKNEIYSVSLSLADFLGSLKPAIQLTSAACGKVRLNRDVNNGVLTDTAVIAEKNSEFADACSEINSDISMEDIDEACFMISAAKAFDDKSPIEIAVSISMCVGFAVITVFLPLSIALIFASSVILFVPNVKNLSEMLKRSGTRINSVIFAVLICISAIPVISGAKLTAFFAVAAIPLIVSVLMRGGIAHFDISEKNDHTYLFVLQSSSIAGIIGYSVFIGGASKLRLPHILFTKAADACESVGLAEDALTHGITASVWYGIFVIFTLLSALYPLYAVKRLGCQFTSKRRRIVSDSRVSDFLLLALSILPLPFIFGPVGFEITNDVTENLITMIAGAVIVLASELLIPIFRRQLGLEVSRDQRSEYLCGMAAKTMFLPDGAGEKPRIKPNIQINK